MDKWPLGVFASIDAGLGVKLEVAHALGVPTIHLHAPHATTRTKRQAEQFLARLKDLGIRISVVFGGFEGESYADIPTVARTVGLVPPATRAERLTEMEEISDFAGLLGVDAVALHVGFVTDNTADPQYGQLAAAVGRVCDRCRANGQNLHLETGQEDADSLLRFLGDVGRENLFINFDPANMILYGSGEPIEALRKVGHRVRSVHCKDAKWAAARARVGRRSAPGRRRRGHGDVPANPERAGLHRSLDHRTGNSPGTEPSEGRNRPRPSLAERTEGENRLKGGGKRDWPPAGAALHPMDPSQSCQAARTV